MLSHVSKTGHGWFMICCRYKTISCSSIVYVYVWHIYIISSNLSLSTKGTGEWDTIYICGIFSHRLRLCLATVENGTRWVIYGVSEVKYDNLLHCNINKYFYETFFYCSFDQIPTHLNIFRYLLWLKNIFINYCFEIHWYVSRYSVENLRIIYP